MPAPMTASLSRSVRSDVDVSSLRIVDFIRAGGTIGSLRLQKPPGRELVLGARGRRRARHGLERHAQGPASGISGAGPARILAVETFWRPRLNSHPGHAEAGSSGCAGNQCQEPLCACCQVGLVLVQPLRAPFGHGAAPSPCPGDPWAPGVPWEMRRARQGCATRHAQGSEFAPGFQEMLRAVASPPDIATRKVPSTRAFTRIGADPPLRRPFSCRSMPLPR